MRSAHGAKLARSSLLGLTIWERAEWVLDVNSCWATDAMSWWPIVSGKHENGLYQARWKTAQESIELGAESAGSWRVMSTRFEQAGLVDQSMSAGRRGCTYLSSDYESKLHLSNYYKYHQHLLYMKPSTHGNWFVSNRKDLEDRCTSPPVVITKAIHGRRSSWEALIGAQLQLHCTWLERHGEIEINSNFKE